MRIVLFTVEETQYVPALLDALLERHGGRVVAAFVSRSLFNKRLRRSGFLIRNWYPFCIRAGDWFRFARLRISGRRRASAEGGSILTHLRGRGIPTEYIEEIKTEETLRKFRALKPDVFPVMPLRQDRPAGVPEDSDAGNL